MIHGELTVYEDQSYLQCIGNVDAFETRKAFADIVCLFGAHLGM